MYLYPSFHPFLNHFVTIFHSFIQTKGNNSGSCEDNSSNSSGLWGDNSSTGFHPSSLKLCLFVSNIIICNIQNVCTFSRRYKIYSCNQLETAYFTASANKFYVDHNRFIQFVMQFQKVKNKLSKKSRNKLRLFYSFSMVSFIRSLILLPRLTICST